MKALWYSCVLGLLCTSVCQGVGNTVAVTQTPPSISKMHINSSVSITCSITATNVLGVTLIRRFDQQDVVYLHLNDNHIGTETITRYKGRVESRVDSPGGTSLRITFALSKLLAEDTDLYYCHWSYITGKLEAATSNGSIIIVDGRAPHRGQTECRDDFFLSDIGLLSLSLIAMIFLMCFLLFIIFMCKRFTKKFTPGNNLPPRRSQHIPQPPPSPMYQYLSASASLGFRQV